VPDGKQLSLLETATNRQEKMFSSDPCDAKVVELSESEGL
jgi:hypothetical protein